MKAILSHSVLSEKNKKINIAGSKSESNRLLILQAQFPEITIENLSDSDDTKVLKNGLNLSKGTVDIHHAGTAMRFLTAYFSTKEGVDVILTGSERMQQRPISILVEALRSLGADIQYENKEGYPPLRIKGKLLPKNEVDIEAGVSSQYISALMLIAPKLSEGLKIKLKGKTTSVPYIEMTLSLLEKIGVKGHFSANTIKIPTFKNVEKTTITVESDWSSASYFYSLVALSNDAEIVLSSFSEKSLQGDAALVSIYEQLGVKTTFDDSANTITLSKTDNELPDSLLLDLINTPDLAQTIAVSCFGLGVSCLLTGLHTLKIKETDRLSAMQTELQKLGATVAIDAQSLKLEKSGKINSGIAIDTYHDHRMAMAFAPLTLKTNLIINEAMVVSKSYPAFWEDLKSLGIHIVLE